MPRSLLRAASLCLILVCFAVDVFSASTAAAQGKPSVMHGFLRSKVRGLSAVQGGFLSGSIMAVATGTGMQAAVVNMLRLLGGAAKLSEDPGMAEMHNYLRTGKGFDFSGAPVSAGYDVHLDFVLVSDGKGDYRLKSGNASYSGNTDADLTLGEGAGIHRFTDQFQGQATVKLTPENASITLATTGKGKDRRSQFDVNVRFPVPLLGKTTWSAMGGLSVVTMEERADASITHHRAFGQENTETRPRGAQWNAGVVYSYSGPSDSVLRGRETWQDIADSGEMVEWELWGDCSATMLSPEENDELVYDALVPARIERLALARVQPSFWEQDLDWSFHEIPGSDLEPRPGKTKGNDFDVTYTRMPDKNSSFAYWDVEARFVTDRAKKAGCKSPEPRKVGYFYPQKGTNNLGPNARAPESADKSGMDPNWFYYWQQTRAAQSRAKEIRYGGGVKYCVERETTVTVNGVSVTYKSTDPIYGFSSGGDPYIVVCDLSALDFESLHPFVPLFTRGIDTYAVTVVHELKHHDLHEQWWPGGYSPMIDTDGDKKKDLPILDTDVDFIPDLIEAKVAVPAPLNGRHKFFDTDLNDTVGRGYNDEHYLAWMAEATWKPRTAMKEDWSCPGQQARSCK